MNYRRWIAHFHANRANRPEPAWDAPLALSESARAGLAATLAEYQLGDGGGPCRLIAADAESFRGATAEATQVVDLWFDEEREHSRLLARAVRRLGGTFVETTFAFRLFCRVRQMLGVQFEMLVLLVVEIVSTGYYRVIRAHCGDAPVADMCRLILRDEAQHIAFHADRLAARLHRAPAFWWRFYFHALGYACALFLWLGHRRRLAAFGVPRAEFFQHVRSGLHVFLRRLRQRTKPASQARKRTVVSAPIAASLNT
jgi:hypothetical protein